MKILLIYPIDRDFMPPSVFPLGIAYIASVLREKKHDVELLDLNVEREKGEQKLQCFLEQNEYAWIGVSSIITQYKKVKEISRIIKSIVPKTPLVMGGAGPTSHPNLYLKYANADIVVVGEGEQTVLDLCVYLAQGRLENCKGIYLKQNHEVVLTEERLPLDDLNAIPLPGWASFSIETYLENCLFKDGQHGRGINIITSRGCPGRCTYCMRNFGNKMRYRSVESIIGELLVLYNDYGVTHFHFIDDTIAANNERLLSLVDELIRLSISITWSANARVTQVKPHLLHKMSDSGCVRISYGIESADPQILKEMKKGITPSLAEKAIQWTREAGIDARAYFMIGFPSESEDTIRNTVDFCKKNLVGGEFFFLTPFPGSEVYDYALEKGLIKDEDTYLEVAGEVRNFVINCTKNLDNETLFGLKEQAEVEIRRHLKSNGIEFKHSIRENPREAVKKLPMF